MNFELTQDQQQIQQLAREFAEKDLLHGVIERDEKVEFPLDACRKFGKTGIYGLPYGTEVGGLGGSYLSYILAVEEVSKVDAAFALHIFSTTPVGEVTYCTGVTSSSLDSFIVNIQGKGGHSSTPQLSIDPLMIANQIYTAANMLMTREVDPKATATLSAGVLRSGTAVNILPDTATLQMGMRTYDKEARAHILERLPQIIDHYVKAWRGDYELVTFNCPCTYTDDTVSHELLPAIAEIVGEENISNTGPMAGTEDFSYVAEAVPSMFICLGAGGPDQYPHHNPRMVLDESVFFQGAAIHANCAMEWLNKHGK